MGPGSSPLAPSGYTLPILRSLWDCADLCGVVGSHPGLPVCVQMTRLLVREQGHLEHSRLACCKGHQAPPAPASTPALASILTTAPAPALAQTLNPSPNPGPSPGPNPGPGPRALGVVSL